jgi:hypothetical protein
MLAQVPGCYPGLSYGTPSALRNRLFTWALPLPVLYQEQPNLELKGAVPIVSFALRARGGRDVRAPSKWALLILQLTQIRRKELLRRGANGDETSVLPASQAQRNGESASLPRPAFESDRAPV